jgi:acyl-CoA synthetase (AMP-forming)/AMP-acid ligase II
LPGGAPTFWELVENAAERFPDETILTDDFGRSLTAATYHASAEREAQALSELGIDKGHVVSWQLPTTLEAVVLMAALARLGAVQNPIIPIFRDREVGFMVRELGSQFFVVPGLWRGFDYAALAYALPSQAIVIELHASADGVSLTPSAPRRLGGPPSNVLVNRWVYYSSGTTADPKGARHSDTSVIASSNGVVDAIGMRRGDVYPIAWPLAHIGGIAMLTAALRTGGQLVLFDHFDPSTTPGRMAAHRPTILGSATPFFQAYVSAQAREGPQPLYPALRICVGGGAATSASVNRSVAETLGVAGVTGAWGLTEFPVATSEAPTDPFVGSTVGRPVKDVEVRVVDGELRLKGPQCFQGYVDNSLDEGAFDEDGWFRTGDLGSIDSEGRVRIEGRSKEVIIRNAENVSATEVEEVLRRYPKVMDVAVIGIPDELAGERVCAVAVAQGGELSLAELVSHCRDEGLARFKWPERLQLVDVLPRNPMGKVLKRALPVSDRPIFNS